MIDTWPSITKRFQLGKDKCYLTVLLNRGKPCRIFLDVAKEGSTLGGFADQWAHMFSDALANGQSLESLVRTAQEVRFPPDGWTDLGFAKSIPDYCAKYLARMFLK